MMTTKTIPKGWMLTLLSAVFMFITFTACEEVSTDASLDPDFIEFEAKGGTQKVKVDKQEYKSYGLLDIYYEDYDYIDEEDEGWLSVKDNNDGTYTFTAKPNTTPDKREVKVRFWFSNNDNPKYIGGDPKSVRVIQKGNDDASVKTDMIEHAYVNAFVISGRFVDNNGKEYDGQEGDGAIWFSNSDWNNYSFTQKTTMNDNNLHVELSGNKDDCNADLSFDINDFNNLEIGKSKLVNVQLTYEDPTPFNRHYSVKITDIPITEIEKNIGVRIRAFGEVGNGVKFSDFTFSSTQKSLKDVYYDSQHNGIDIYIKFN